VKSGIAISFAAASALLISIATGAGSVGVGKACDGFVFHPQECNPGLFCEKAWTMFRRRHLRHLRAKAEILPAD